MRSDKLFLAIALATTAANGAKLTVSADGVNLDGTPLADRKLTKNTEVAELEISGGQLDLAGHNLTFNGTVNALNIHTDASASINSSISEGEPAVIKFKFTDGARRFAGDLLKPITFKGNLTLELNGLSTGGKWLFGGNEADNPHNNKHIGGTIFDQYYISAGADINTVANYARFGGNINNKVHSTDLGEGPVTLKNGSMLVYTGPDDKIQPWTKLIAVNESANSYTNVLRLENRMVLTGTSVEVDEYSRLMIATKNKYLAWTNDFSKVRGWLGFCGEYSSSIRAVFTGTENVGFPNAHVQVFEPDKEDKGIKQVYQLRFESKQDVPIKIGELSTPDTVKQATTNVVIVNVSGATRTLEIGGLGTDSTFYGKISANGASGLNVTKVGQGTLTLGGENTYTGDTTVSAGTLKVQMLTSGAWPTGKFTVENGAKLELTLRNNSSTRLGDDGCRNIPTGSTINFSATNPSYLPRLGAVEDFIGIINFIDSDETVTAVGFVKEDNYTYGSNDISWGILGEPTARKVLFHVDANTNAKVNMGAFNMPSENAVLYCKPSTQTTFNIGALNTDSYINGWITARTATSKIEINHTGSGTLTLGKDFKTTVCDIQGTPITYNDDAKADVTINIKSGALVNYADLSKINLKVQSGTTIVNYGTLGAVELYKYENDGSTITTVARMDAEGKITYAMNSGRAVEIAKLAYKYSNDELASNYDSYFETKVTSNGDNAYTYEITLKDEAKPTIGAGSDGQAATIEGQSIKFNHEKMNLKPGLYYAISAKEKPDEEATADSYKLYTTENASNFSLSADLPESGVKYYKVLVSDNENGK